jgi:hypothetical protein
MNLDATYRTIWCRYCEGACRLAILLELVRKFLNFGYSEWIYYPDITAWGQRIWTFCLCQPVCPLPLQHTPSSGLLPVYALLGRKYAHLRKLFFVAHMGFDFVRKRCNDIRKPYRLIKMVTGRKVSGSIPYEIPKVVDKGSFVLTLLNNQHIQMWREWSVQIN